MQLQALQNLSSSRRTSTDSLVGNSDAFMNMLAVEVMSLLTEQQQIQSAAQSLSLPKDTSFAAHTLNQKTNTNIQQAVTPTIPTVGKGEYGYQSNRVHMPALGNKEKYTRYDHIIEEMGQKYNVDPKLIKSMIKHESDFNSKTVSHAGAAGLMQLMPVNAKEFGVTDRFDPRQNIEAGTREIRKYLNKYDGDLKLSLAAYNAGMGNVRKYGGVPPFKETQNYIKKVTNTYYS
nr:lytic transglycosylase domain-containing protein [Priestia taiwanensis]